MEQSQRVSKPITGVVTEQPRTGVLEVQPIIGVLTEDKACAAAEMLSFFSILGTFELRSDVLVTVIEGKGKCSKVGF